MKDYVIVSAEFWNFLEEVFQGGPRLPVCTIPYHQVKLVPNNLKYDFITHMNIETIPNELAIPTKNVRFLVTVQLSQECVPGLDNFIQFPLVIPIVLRLS
jgi:hypothetical protein